MCYVLCVCVGVGVIGMDACVLATRAPHGPVPATHRTHTRLSGHTAYIGKSRDWDRAVRTYILGNEVVPHFDAISPHF
jgi:hypothetical protein